MASQSLISTINGYENYIEKNGVDEQVINAYVDACSVAINGEKDIEYGLQLTKRAKELIEGFCTAKTGGTIWDLEKYAFDHKTTYELINKKYEVLLLEAQNKIVDSYFQYIEKKREPKDRFYMPRRRQLIKIGLVDALQGMIDDKYDILCVSLVPGAGKSTIEKFFIRQLPVGFQKTTAYFIHTVAILHECTTMEYTTLLLMMMIMHGMTFSLIYQLQARMPKWSNLILANTNLFRQYNVHLLEARMPEKSVQVNFC